jgi:hypothetical protein
MRFGDSQIKKVMDDRKNFLAGLPLEFDGPHAKRLNSWWKQFQADNSFQGTRLTLAGFMSYTMDSVSTYGFSLLEKKWEDGEDEPLLYVWPVDPVTIFEFNQPDGKSLKPENIKFWNLQKGGFLELEASNFYLESNQIYPGNFWGLSDLYPLIKDYLVMDTEYQMYMSNRTLERGIIIAQENESGTTENASNTMVDSLQGILKGQSPALIMDKGWNPLTMLQVSSGNDTVGQFITSRDKFDERVKTYFDSTLTTLGISSSGSRALGETFKVADAEKFKSFLEGYFEKFLASEIMIDICEKLEIPHEEVQIATPGIIASSDRFDIDKVLNFMEKTSIGFDTLGEKNQRLMLEGLGLDFTDFKKTNAPPVVDASVEAVVASSELSEDLPFVMPKEASQTASSALLERAKRAGIAKGLSPKELDLAKRIASNSELTPLEINLLKAWFSNEQLKEQPIKDELLAFEFRALGGESMMKALFPVSAEPLEESETLMSALKDVDLKPSKGMIEEAKKGLEWRREYGRGGTEVGVARARDISNGKNLSPETVGRMASFFARHEDSSKGGQGWAPGEDGFPSAGRIAWALWGGDAGKTWAQDKMKSLEVARGEE